MVSNETFVAVVLAEKRLGRAVSIEEIRESWSPRQDLQRDCGLHEEIDEMVLCGVATKLVASSVTSGTVALEYTYRLSEGGWRYYNAMGLAATPFQSCWPSQDDGTPRYHNSPRGGVCFD